MLRPEPVEQAARPGPGSVSVVDQVRALLETPSYRPPVLPRAALRIVELTQQEGASFDEVIEVLESDPVLAGHVLSLVRTPFYSMNRPVVTLREAIVRMGTSTLRQSVIEVALGMGVFQCKPYRRTMEAVALHCRATGHLARLTARRISVSPDMAFLCGLLHDVGHAGLLILLAEKARWGRPVDLGDVRGALDTLHAQAGDKMAEAWGIAPAIRSVIAWHEDADASDDPVLDVVRVADSLADELGYAIPGPRGTAVPAHGDETAQDRARTAAGRLHLDEDDLAAIRTAATSGQAALT